MARLHVTQEIRSCKSCGASVQGIVFIPAKDERPGLSQEAAARRHPRQLDRALSARLFG